MAGRAVLKAAQAEVNESSRRRDDILEDDLSASHDLAVWVGFGGGGLTRRHFECLGAKAL